MIVLRPSSSIGTLIPTDSDSCNIWLSNKPSNKWRPKSMSFTSSFSLSSSCAKKFSIYCATSSRGCRSSKIPLSSPMSSPVAPPASSEAAGQRCLPSDSCSGGSAPANYSIVFVASMSSATTSLDILCSRLGKVGERAPLMSQVEAACLEVAQREPTSPSWLASPLSPADFGLVKGGRCRRTPPPEGSPNMCLNSPIEMYDRCVRCHAHRWPKVRRWKSISCLQCREGNKNRGCG